MAKSTFLLSWLPSQDPQPWPLSSHLTPSALPCWKREKSRSSGSTWAPRQMGDQVCAHLSSRFMSQAGSRSLHDLPLLGPCPLVEVPQGSGTHTVLGQLPPVQRLLSSLNLTFALGNPAVSGRGSLWKVLLMKGAIMKSWFVWICVTLNGGVDDRVLGMILGLLDLVLEGPTLRLA